MTIEKASVGGVCLWLEGYTQEEIGERMGIDRTQISRDLRVILILLRKALT